MNWGGPEFVLAIIALATIGGVVKTWIHAKHGLPMPGRRTRRWEKYAENRGDGEQVSALKAENARLTDRLEASEDRLAVLERIVTDKSYNLASEIEALRDREPRLERDKTI
ncbi:MAG: hypothetical protein P0Y56_14385 [Candidatus Andeanibacterium colombiense]|uniref:Uncharacterized protein n=1 Tax=Candidatus Andeanibacterium colombiense TaxID=3121345 RepID=A0AAJ5X5Y5_9SPHN|nr:MAG: hypothetical protein P0Y56_14385 [Sphingomonadaceae bacterium]